MSDETPARIMRLPTWRTAWQEMWGHLSRESQRRFLQDAKRLGISVDQYVNEILREARESGQLDRLSEEADEWFRQRNQIKQGGA